MLARLLRWNIVAKANYTLVDEMDENIRFARAWLPEWAGENGLKIEEISTKKLADFRCTT